MQGCRGGGRPRYCRGQGIHDARGSWYILEVLSDVDISLRSLALAFSSAGE